MKILVSGSLAYDRIMDFDGRFKDHILPDKIHVLNVSFYVEKFRLSFGGTSVNIAYNLAMLNEKPYILSAYGDDFKDYKKWCNKNHLNVQYARHINRVQTSSSYIITDQSDNQIAGFFAGAMKYSNGPIPKNILDKNSFGIVSPGNIEDMEKYPKAYKKSKMPYMYDPGQQIVVMSKKGLLSGILGAKVFISNDYELDLVLKKTGLTKSKLLKRVEIVVTTLGEKGSLIYSNGKKYKIPAAKPKNTSDPTGAGDAYRAGLVKGLLAGYSLPKTGRLAAVVSVYTVEEYGTQTHRFNWNDIKKRYYRNFRDKL